MKDKMDTFSAMMIAEGEWPAKTPEHYLAAWQHLVDIGLVWRLQGWFGRTAAAMIERGDITRQRYWHIDEGF